MSGIVGNMYVKRMKELESAVAEIISPDRGACFDEWDGFCVHAAAIDAAQERNAEWDGSENPIDADYVDGFLYILSQRNLTKKLKG